MLNAVLLAYLRHMPIEQGKGRLARLVRSQDLPATTLFTARSGVRYDLDLGEYLQRNLYVFGDYERNTLRHVRRLLQPGWTVVDVGGNVGFHALEMAQVCHPGRVVSFEPNPPALERFRKNLALNPHLDNIELVACGVSDRPGSLTLSYNQGNLGTASAFGTSSLHSEVPVDTLDDLLEQRGIRSVDLLKVDIEGGEMAALKGALRTIGRSPNMVLVTEIIDEHCKRAGYSGDVLFRFIRSLGFKAYLPKPWPSALRETTTYDPGYFDNMIFLRGVRP
ncbi:MAG: FkbM family methyltransferase [Flavobacteriales bacterium]